MHSMILYSNSCSVGKPTNYKIYPELLAERYNGELINDALAGACNRRIIRTSLRSLIKLTQNNNSQKKIVALIGLSYLARTELWQPSMEPDEYDGDFHSIVNDKIVSLDWSKGLNNTFIPDIAKYLHSGIREYYKQWLIHYSKEATSVELLADIIMLCSFAKVNNINILIFNNCQKWPTLPEVDRNSAFLQDFVNISKQLPIIDLWEFSFKDYAAELNHIPVDFKNKGLNGYPNSNAHYDFSLYLHDYIHNLYDD